MFKRIMLWFAMNIAIMVVLSIIFAILESVFGIKMDLYGTNYVAILIYAMVIGFLGSLISLALSKWMAKKAYKMTFITSENLHTLDDKEKTVYNTVLEISERSRITIPEIGIYISNDPNAFATGRSKNSSLIAVSTGLLSAMDKDAIEGVVAHEMAHIVNGDMVTMALLQGILNTFVIFFSRIIANIIADRLDKGLSGIAYLAVNILLQILFGILASLIAMKFSRYREFKADAGSAKFVGKQKMIAGLKVLKSMQNLASDDNSKLAAMKISTKKRTGIKALFSSHPDLDDRIKALENLIL